jgi:hypothetical protein
MEERCVMPLDAKTEGIHACWIKKEMLQAGAGAGKEWAACWCTPATPP